MMRIIFVATESGSICRRLKSDLKVSMLKRMFILEAERSPLYTISWSICWRQGFRLLRWTHMRRHTVIVFINMCQHTYATNIHAHEQLHKQSITTISCGHFPSWQREPISFPFPRYVSQSEGNGLPFPKGKVPKTSCLCNMQTLYRFMKAHISWTYIGIHNVHIHAHT